MTASELDLDLAKITHTPKCMNCASWVAVPNRAKGKCRKHDMDTLDLDRCTAWQRAGNPELTIKREAKAGENDP